MKPCNHLCGVVMRGMLAVFVLTLNGTCCEGISLPKEGFCEQFGGRRILITPGEQREIKFEKFDRFPESNDSSSQVCRIEIVTWRDCHFVVTFYNLNLPRCSNIGICRCDYISIRQPEYKKSYVEFCGSHTNSSTNYESKTNIIAMDFVYGSPYGGTFATQVKALRNIYTIRGHHDHYNLNSSGYLESPYFPYTYPTDYSAEYVLINDDPKGFVQLVFTDFQLAQWSELLVYDTNRSQIGVFNGNILRPPVIYSTGRNLSVKFSANGEYPNLGFRANFIFISYIGRYMLSKPNTDCGGLLDNSGGVIIMANMAKGSHAQLYDCIWIIHPSSIHGTHLSLQVSQLEDVGTKPVLKIRRGLTSKSPLIATVKNLEPRTGSASQNQEYTVLLPGGFYVRLQGFFSNKSRVEMIYSTFKYDACTSGRSYRCSDGRCIDSLLHCDGFDHCRDGSDERSCITYEATVSSVDGNWWHTLTPNYYFPKQDSSGTGTNTLILITSLAGLGMFIITTTLILFKLHKQRRDESNMQQALHTISQDVDTHSHNFHHPAELPLYDPPPSYDDVIKFYLAPPPTYTSVTGTDGDSMSGIENAAFVPDAEPPPVAHPIPSLIALVLPTPQTEKDGLTFSERQLARRATLKNDSAASNCVNGNQFAERDPSATAENRSAICNPNLDESSLIVRGLEPAVEKHCICEGACSCPLHSSVTRLLGDNSEFKSSKDLFPREAFAGEEGSFLGQEHGIEEANSKGSMPFQATKDSSPHGISSGRNFVEEDVIENLHSVNTAAVHDSMSEKSDDISLQSKAFCDENTIASEYEAICHENQSESAEDNSNFALISDRQLLFDRESQENENETRLPVIVIGSEPVVEEPSVHTLGNSSGDDCGKSSSADPLVEASCSHSGEISFEDISPNTN